jgi:hypothetical protein
VPAGISGAVKEMASSLALHRLHDDAYDGPPHHFARNAAWAAVSESPAQLSASLALHRRANRAKHGGGKRSAPLAVAPKMLEDPFDTYDPWSRSTTAGCGLPSVGEATVPLVANPWSLWAKRCCPSTSGDSSRASPQLQSSGRGLHTSTSASAEDAASDLWASWAATSSSLSGGAQSGAMAATSSIASSPAGDGPAASGAAAAGPSASASSASSVRSPAASLGEGSSAPTPAASAEVAGMPPVALPVGSSSTSQLCVCIGSLEQVSAFARSMGFGLPAPLPVGPAGGFAGPSEVTLNTFDNATGPVSLSRAVDVATQCQDDSWLSMPASDGVLCSSAISLADSAAFSASVATFGGGATADCSVERCEVCLSNASCDSLLDGGSVRWGDLVLRLLQVHRWEGDSSDCSCVSDNDSDNDSPIDTFAPAIRPSVGELVARLELAAPSTCSTTSAVVAAPMPAVFGDEFVPGCGCGARMVLDPHLGGRPGVVSSTTCDFVDCSIPDLLFGSPFYHCMNCKADLAYCIPCGAKFGPEFVGFCSDDDND